MKKIVPILLIMSIFATSNAQVITRYSNAQSINSLGAIKSSNYNAYQLPVSMIPATKDANDSTIGKIIAVEDALIKANGTWTTTNDMRVWNVGVKCDNARFSALYFSHFAIPQGCELYIYSPDRTILMGPFDSRNNADGGSYATDVIDGDELILEYHQPI